VRTKISLAFDKVVNFGKCKYELSFVSDAFQTSAQVLSGPFLVIMASLSNPPK